MKAEEVSKYWQELVAKRNIPPEVAAKITEALGHETVQRAFAEDFKAIPEYSRGLDEVRDKTRSEIENQYRDWYAKANDAYQANLKGIEELNKYKQLYGDLATNSANPSDTKTGITREDVEKLLEEKFGLQNKVYSDLLKQVPSIQIDYLRRFNEPLDVNEVEKLVPKHGGNVEAAYREFIQPKVDAINATAAEKAKKEAYEQGVKDALSKKTPMDTRPRDLGPAFGPAPKDGDNPNAGRDAFLDSWQSFGQPT